MSRIKEQIAEIQKGLPEGVLLVAVTKTRSIEEINEAIDAGITDIGENKVQEILEKFEKIKPVKLHMIGHLQTNKVKYIIDKVDLIHSVDSYKLAEEINKRAKAHGITMDILVQVNVAQEESKFGTTLEETETLIESIVSGFENIRIKGLMTIAPFEENPEDVRIYFSQAKALYGRLKDKHGFVFLSMGMSHDYKVAVDEGSNLVRIGTSIFGERNYK